MTFNQEEVVGRLVLRYSANEQHLAELSSALSEAGRQLTTLGNQLARQAVRISVESTELVIPDNYSVSKELLGTVAEQLEALHAAYEEKRAMEDSLRQAGLEYLIKR